MDGVHIGAELLRNSLHEGMWTCEKGSPGGRFSPMWPWYGFGERCNNKGFRRGSRSIAIVTCLHQSKLSDVGLPFIRRLVLSSVGARSLLLDQTVFLLGFIGI